jgi:hypothetical protein
MDVSVDDWVNKIFRGYQSSQLVSSPTYQGPSLSGLISDPDAVDKDDPLKVGNFYRLRRRIAREDFFNFSRREISDFTNGWVDNCMHGLMDE